MHSGLLLETTFYTQAAVASLFHLVNHSTFKGALFMVIGIIDYRVGTRDLRRLGGLITVMPFSFTIALIGSFSMARSEEHTSELQSRGHLVCRLLLEKKYIF